MPNHGERLSSGDALFLYLEREGMPLNVASVNVFDGVIPFRSCTRFIESKLPFIPRYQQRVVAPPFNIGVPTWQYDPDFDIRNHVRQVTLKYGTDAEFKAVAGKILSQMMDRQRPLWDFTLVHGVKGKRTGVVTRMHHCMADGLAGVELLNVLMDSSPELPTLARSKRHLRVPTANQSTTSLLDELFASSTSLAERVLTAETEFLGVLKQVVAAAGRSQEDSAPQGPLSNGQGPDLFGEFTKLLPEVTGSTQALPFNIICRGPQKFAWTEIPLADLKAVKNAFGATINDVVLTLVASAIQRYVERRGVNTRGRMLRIAVPVNVRGNDSASELGNRITFLPVTIPLDIHNVSKLLAAIRERVAFLRNVHLAELVGMAGTMLGTIPTAAQVVIGNLASQVPLGLSNIICTNVPGPAAPLYLLGHKMLRCYPYVPIGGDIGVNCAVLTYNGTACFGFIGDVHAAPDLQYLEKFLITAFSELQRSAEAPIRRTRGKRRSTNGVPSRPKSVAPVAPMPDRSQGVRSKKTEGAAELAPGLAV